MTAGRRTLVAGAISLAALVAVGAPLIAQPGNSGNAPGKGPPAAPGKGKVKAKLAPKSTTSFATLLGRNEIGTDGTRRAGDLDGQGGATVITTDAQLCFAVAVRGIATPQAMHVHRGRPNANGAIVVDLTAPAAGDPGTAAGCVDAASALLQEITRHPIRFYVNVHNGDFPNGALRGQLHKAPRWR